MYEMNLKIEAEVCTTILDLEVSPSGLWRTLGKRVGLTPSRVQIPQPPPLDVTRWRCHE